LRALIEIVNLRSTNTNLKGLRNGSWEKLNWKRWKNRWSSESCNLPIKCNLDKTHELYLKDLIVCMYVRQFKTFTKRNVLQQQLHKYLGDLFYWFKWSSRSEDLISLVVDILQRKIHRLECIR
jgi:hypothetical protein